MLWVEHKELSLTKPKSIPQEPFFNNLQPFAKRNESGPAGDSQLKFELLQLIQSTPKAFCPSSFSKQGRSKATSK
ncbi:MAG: hypothetical protein CK426_07790 [Legionella sp.]|nr:MAG: hypothetical protein CK426_07790 [Legionella sp.]